MIKKSFILIICLLSIAPFANAKIFEPARFFDKLTAAVSQTQNQPQCVWTCVGCLQKNDRMPLCPIRVSDKKTAGQECKLINNKCQLAPVSGATQEIKCLWTAPGICRRSDEPQPRTPAPKKPAGKECVIMGGSCQLIETGSGGGIIPVPVPSPGKIIGEEKRDCTFWLGLFGECGQKKDKNIKNQETKQKEQKCNFWETWFGRCKSIYTGKEEVGGDDGKDGGIIMSAPTKKLNCAWRGQSCVEIKENASLDSPQSGIPGYQCRHSGSQCKICRGPICK